MTTKAKRKHAKAPTTKRKRAKAPTNTVKFLCYAPEASSVFVAGTFNDWDPKQFPLERKEEGHWEASLDMKAGSYEYKFVVDSEWVCMPGCGEECPCPDCTWNEHGTFNRVLEVAGLVV